MEKHELVRGGVGQKGQGALGGGGREEGGGERAKGKRRAEWERPWDGGNKRMNIVWSWHFTAESNIPIETFTAEIDMLIDKTERHNSFEHPNIYLHT